MSQVESPLGTLDIESASRHEWLSWTKMADVERAAPPVLVGGDGPYVIESDGTRLLDAMSGLFTTQIGYSHGAELGAAQGEAQVPGRAGVNGVDSESAGLVGRLLKNGCL